MGTSTFQRAFAGGELAPALSARADQVRYVTGLRRCRNFIVQRSGGVANRPGTRFIAESKTNATSVFLLRYVADVAGESLLIEAGAFYLRFYKNGAAVNLTAVPAWAAGPSYTQGDIVAEAGINYWAKAAVAPGLSPAANPALWYPMPGTLLEIPSPFGNPGFSWVQSGNVITLTSRSQAVRPHELIYFSLTRWTINPISTVPSLAAPTGVVVTPGLAGTLSYQYQVTAGAAESYEESLPSIIVQVNTIGEPTAATPHLVAWNAVAGAAEYYVYLDPFGNGIFGYIGTAVGQLSFRDTGMVPDFAITPPLPRVLFAGGGDTDKPSKAAYYQQRRFFANTKDNPDAVWGSRTGFHSNFNVSSPLQDDDAITFRMAGNQHNPVRHLVGLKSLIVLTDGGEWNVRGPGGGALTPNGILSDQETYVGVSDVVPVIVGNSVIYVQARGAILRDLQFDQTVEGLAGRDLTLFASHLVDGYSLDKLDYQQTPHSIVWACRSDGTLLGLTYIREQEIAGWHRHDTGAGGLFEDVCVVPEPGEDAVYVLVRRTIGDVFKRYIERLERREIQNFNVDSFFVDAGLTYNDPDHPVTTIAGLGHLEGEIVSVVCDGAVVFNGDPNAINVEAFRVSGGTIAAVLPEATVIHAGLPIRYAEIETLDLDVEGSDVRAKKKRVGLVTLLLENSVRTFYAGPNEDGLVQVVVDEHETGLETVAFTGQEYLNLTADYNDYGRVLIRHVDPLPLTILGALPNTELGG